MQLTELAAVLAVLYISKNMLTSSSNGSSQTQRRKAVYVKPPEPVAQAGSSIREQPLFSYGNSPLACTLFQGMFFVNSFLLGNDATLPGHFLRSMLTSCFYTQMGLPALLSELFYQQDQPVNQGKGGMEIFMISFHNVPICGAVYGFVLGLVVGNLLRCLVPEEENADQQTGVQPQQQHPHQP